VNVGVGVDGSASNDGSHLMEEVRQAMLISRLGEGVRLASMPQGGSNGLMTARQALEIATQGGAAVLGRDDIGSLQVGKCADFVAINLNRLEYAGALHDPVAAVVFCAPVRVDFTVVGGKFVVKGGKLATVDHPSLVNEHNLWARKLLED